MWPRLARTTTKTGRLGNAESRRPNVSPRTFRSREKRLITVADALGRAVPHVLRSRDLGSEEELRVHIAIHVEQTGERFGRLDLRSPAAVSPVPPSHEEALRRHRNAEKS